MVCELSGEGSRQDTMGRVTLKVVGVDAAIRREGTGLATGGTRTTSGVCCTKGCSARVRAVAVSISVVSDDREAAGCGAPVSCVEGASASANNCLQGVRAAGRYMVIILGRGVQDGMLGTDVFLFQHKSGDIEL